MKNEIINKFKSKIKINIKGKNIERFIRRIIKNNIEIIKLEQIKYNEINIIIYKEELEKIENIKTIYEIEIKRNYGYERLKDILKKNKYILLFLIIGLCIIYTLSNMIFEIEIVHNDKKIRELLKEELKNYGIDKYHFKKNYHTKEKIKLNLLNKYNDKLEWIEIEEVGTKYIIRVEERILNEKEESLENRHIIAKKNGIIIDIDATKGEIVKNINDYVKKGDIIISGNIYLNENITSKTPAIGKVEAETWYTVDITYPYHYKDITLTNDKKTVYTLKIFNNYYDLFNFNKYKTKQVENKTILKNNFLPIKLLKQQQIKTIEIDETYDKKEIITKAITKAKKELLNKLNNDSEILNYHILSKEENKEGVKLKLFFSVKENITDYLKIEEVPDKN